MVLEAEVLVAEDTQSAKLSYLADLEELDTPLVFTYLGYCLLLEVRSVMLDVSVVVAALCSVFL